VVELQPDQRPERWNDHVAVYEESFEPLTNVFARRALDHLDLHPGGRLIDVGAGAGGAALIAGGRGTEVTAVDASPGMVARIAARARDAGIGSRVHAKVMDGTALTLPDDGFDAALSVFGVVLFANADLGMREIVRVLKPGGHVAIVTWTAAAANVVAGTAALSRRAGSAQIADRRRPDRYGDRAGRGELAPAIGALDRGPYRLRAGNGGYDRCAR